MLLAPALKLGPEEETRCPAEAAPGGGRGWALTCPEGGCARLVGWVGCSCWEAVGVDGAWAFQSNAPGLGPPSNTAWLGDLCTSFNLSELQRHYL